MLVCSRYISILLVLLLFGCSAASTLKPEPELAANATAKATKAPVEQIAERVITTAEVQQIISGPAASSYFIVDARPANKFEAGHVPGAINLPKALLSQNLDKLPKDKTIIFYCGGLACKLSPQSAEIALQNGFTDVKVWYAGMPGWIRAGNYSVIEAGAVKKLVMAPAKDPFVLIDARPAVKYQQSSID